MDDTISRQAAIVTAVRAAVDWHKLANPQYSIAYCIGEAMRQLPSAQQWIPVQQNPERSGWYIVTKRFGKDGDTWIGTKWYSTAYGWTGDGVLAWMELPEAYKEGE